MRLENKTRDRMKQSFAYGGQSADAALWSVLFARLSYLRPIAQTAVQILLFSFRIQES